MSYDYTSYKAAIQDAIASQSPDPAFDAIYDPSLIDYAEQRIYRELDLLQTVQRLTSSTTTVGSRDMSLDHSFVVVNGINILTPSRVQLVPVSLNALDVLWPGTTVTGVPQVFAMVDQWTVSMGPAPDNTYSVEVIGTYRPAPLSATNTTTFLTQRLPDLFFCAGMVFASGWMRDYGQQSSDPQMGQSWEQQYQTLKASANAEELRKQMWGDSWTPYPAPAGSTGRG